VRYGTPKEKEKYQDSLSPVGKGLDNPYLFRRG